LEHAPNGSQSQAIKDLFASQELVVLHHTEMQKTLKDLLEQQSRAERIKNFPYPRQYATINSIFVWCFSGLLPFCLIREFDRLNESVTGLLAGQMAWLAVPFSALVSWMYVSVGKTALLDYVAVSASGCRVARSAGVESEMELAFAGLHQLCAPMHLPGPQRDALGTAFGLTAGAAADRFLVGLAPAGALGEGFDVPGPGQTRRGEEAGPRRSAACPGGSAGGLGRVQSSQAR
jgi:hypothetical protein